jgi:hypothetical protein
VPRILTALFLCTLACAGQATNKQRQPSSRETTLEDVLSWLPSDTETVIGTNGPFPFPDFDRLEGTARQPELTPVELDLRMRFLPLGLFGLKNGDLQKALQGKPVTFALEGSRHFRPPAALGNMLYEGCEIVVFGSATNLDREAFMKSAANSATRFEEIAGVKIGVFQEHQENDVWTTFVGFPRSDIVLIATNADYLRTVLARMGGVSGPRALPDTLSEWKYVNTRSPAWGLRHYQKTEANSDPTSPFLGQGPYADDLALGLAFSVEPAVRRIATVTYLSANKNSRQFLQGYLGVEDADSASPREFQIRFREPAPGVLEGSETLSVKEAFYRLLFGLSAMLGHAIYL